MSVCSARSEQCKALSVEPLDAHLLEMTEDIDRDTGTMFFVSRHISETLPTREALQGELLRLHGLGWIDLNPQNRWEITPAGREALSAARDFVFEVDDVLDEKAVDGRGQDTVVRGRLVSGSLTFFHSVFAVRRDGAEGDLVGNIGEVRSSEDPAEITLMVSLRIWKPDRHLEQGDLLRRKEGYT